MNINRNRKKKWLSVATAIGNIWQNNRVTSWTMRTSHEIDKGIKSFTPWKRKQIQLVRSPSTNRYAFGPGAAHLATIVKYAQVGNLGLLVEQLAKMMGGMHGFAKPVMFVIFENGKAAEETRAGREADEKKEWSAWKRRVCQKQKEIEEKTRNIIEKFWQGWDAKKARANSRTYEREGWCDARVIVHQSNNQSIGNASAKKTTTITTTITTRRVEDWSMEGEFPDAVAMPVSRNASEGVGADERDPWLSEEAKTNGEPAAELINRTRIQDEARLHALAITIGGAPGMRLEGASRMMRSFSNILQMDRNNRLRRWNNPDVDPEHLRSVKREFNHACECAGGAFDCFQSKIVDSASHQARIVVNAGWVPPPPPPDSWVTQRPIPTSWGNPPPPPMLWESAHAEPSVPIDPPTAPEGVPLLPPSPPLPWNPFTSAASSSSSSVLAPLMPRNTTTTTTSVLAWYGDAGTK